MAKITFELTDEQIEMLEKYRKIIDPKDKIDLNDCNMLVKRIGITNSVPKFPSHQNKLQNYLQNVASNAK